MSIKSMTGYGRGETEMEWGKIVVELTSVNKKHFDFRFDCEHAPAYLEQQVLETAKKRITRGFLTCRVKLLLVSNKKADFFLIDNARAEMFASELRSLAKRLKLNDDLGVSSLITLPGVVRVEHNQFSDEQTWTFFVRALIPALDALETMRRTEGTQLAKDLSKRLKLLEKQALRLEKLAPQVIQRRSTQMKKRLATLGIDASINDEKLLKEIALFADRSDIAEEITRLKSHIRQFSEGLTSNNPIGRTMEFLAQELLREVNTIGSKAGDLRISKIAITCKTEIERIREQVMNIE
ncbi:MAG: YicC family protein [Lentisphaerae bacterium]|nr:YicC family protein [Lentisphaerota bacterium]